MTQKSPDKRVQNRLKKIEDEKQRTRYLAAELVMKGYSLRQVAKKVGRSTYYVSTWSNKLLDYKDIRKPVKGGLKTVRVYTWKKGYKELLKTKKPGPKPGVCPKT